MSEGLNLEVFGQTYSGIKGIRVPGVGADAPTYEYIVPTGTISITTNGEVDVTEYAAASIDVLPENIVLEEEITITPSLDAQTITPETGKIGFELIKVNAITPGVAGTPTAVKSVVNDHTVTITTTVTNSAGYIPSATITGIPITVSAADLVSGTVTLTRNKTTYDMIATYASAYVNIPLETKTITYTPATTTQVQTITANPAYYFGLEKVNLTIDAIPSDYIIPSGTMNINTNGTNINVKEYEAVNVSVTGGTTVTLQNKIVTPSKQPIILTADNGYNGLGTITVQAIPSQYIVPTGELPIYNNGVYDVTNTASVEVDVAGGSTAPNLQQKNATPSTSQITVTPDNGYDGLASVTIAAIPSQYIIPTGAKNITVNGNNIDVKNYATVNVSVAGGSIDYQDGDVLLYGEPPSSIVGTAKVGNAYVGTEE